MELLAHPVRLRIVHAMSGGRAATTAQLHAQMPDVSKATLYRHVDLLAEHGVLEIAGEQRVRGVVERSYRLRRERAVIDADAAAAATNDEHRDVFAIAMATLMAEFQSYLDRGDADIAADQVGYRQHVIWLDRDELAGLIDDLRAVILPRLTHEASADRNPYLLSPILFPMTSARNDSTEGGS
ncbi:helix-turn-helix domain-containing protein [Nocardia sp. NPDC059180]|uniref:helix-turn-helix domain-containing protein n=1 Tax=Nocardia sp. NPDC059180 TaxID=3346761 RepID=UPI0036A55B76